MTAYGSGIAPKWYRDQTPRQYTRMGLAKALYQAFLSVGMVPLRAFNPPGVNLDVMNGDPVVPGDRVDLVWWFDYPTTDTFVVNGVAYRPIIAFSMFTRDSATYENAGAYQINSVTFLQGYRRADATNREALVTDGSLRGHAFYGFGSLTSNAHDVSHGTKGAFASLPYWKNYEGSPNVLRTAYLAVSNFHVMLSPAGLVVQLGSGTGKSDSNDILNMAAAFGGTRIPGRNRIPAQDANLNLINPILWLALNQDTVNTLGIEYALVDDLTLDFMSFSGARRPSARVLGLQHDLKYTTMPVVTHIFNLENMERPLFPIPKAVTLQSPRAATPSAAHIMSRLVYVPWHRFSAPSDYYGVVDTSLRSQPSPTWADLWSAEGVRLCDATAPAGEVTDPNTSDKWFLAQCAPLSTMFAFRTTGMTKLGTVSFPAPVVTSDDSYDLSSAGFSSAFPKATVWTPVGPTFAPEVGQNQMSVSLTSQSSYLTMAITGYGDPGAALLLSCALQNVSTDAAPPDAANLTIYNSIDGVNWIPVHVAQNAGNNSGAPYYLLTPVTDVPVALSSDGKLYIRFDLSYQAYIGTRTARVANIHIKRAG